MSTITPEKAQKHLKALEKIANELGTDLTRFSELVWLRDFVHDGCFTVMSEDLMEELDKKPYIDKIIRRVQEDIPYVDRLQNYQANTKDNLRDVFTHYDAN